MAVCGCLLVDILFFGIFILAVSRSVECGIEHFGLTDVKVDPEQKEVELHLSKEKIQVTDNSTISVDKKGNVQVAK